MEDSKVYKLVSAPGAVAVVVHKRKILLLKRFGFPNRINPGIWTFIAGGKNMGERYVDTAYREVEEEAKISSENLKLLGKGFRITLFERRLRRRWYNQMFIFKANSLKVRLNFENTAYRWATMGEIRRNKSYTNVFIDEDEILRRIGRYVK